MGLQGWPQPSMLRERCILAGTKWGSQSMGVRTDRTGLEGKGVSDNSIRVMIPREHIGMGLMPH